MRKAHTLTMLRNLKYPTFITCWVGCVIFIWLVVEKKRKEEEEKKEGRVQIMSMFIDVYSLVLYRHTDTDM